MGRGVGGELEENHVDRRARWGEEGKKKKQPQKGVKSVWGL